MSFTCMASFLCSIQMSSSRYCSLGCIITPGAASWSLSFFTPCSSWQLKCFQRLQHNRAVSFSLFSSLRLPSPRWQFGDQVEWFAKKGKEHPLWRRAKLLAKSPASFSNYLGTSIEPHLTPHDVDNEGSDGSTHTFVSALRYACTCNGAVRLYWPCPTLPHVAAGSHMPTHRKGPKCGEK